MDLGELRAEPAATSWRRVADDAVEVTAGPRTDLFVDPGGAEPAENAPRLLGDPGEGDWTLSARVAADLTATFDAGVLLLRAGPRTWAKLCLERSPQGRPTVVSVVTRGYSDDANAVPVASPDLALRIARLGRAFAFHARVDGDRWDLVRYFTFDPPGAPAGPVEVGFLAQSPTGDGCVARFSDVTFTRTRLPDLRDGR